MILLSTDIQPTTPLFLIGGPCVIETEHMVMKTAETLKEIAVRNNLQLIFKASFDKANRTSPTAFRGPGICEGLRILRKIKEEIELPVLTDVHEDTPMDEVASVVDVLQTPAFLCRQTNFIERVAAAGRPVNVKKAQFMAPWDMEQVIAKYHAAGNSNILVCDRGTSFGYNTLISDMRGLVTLRRTGCPVVFDATHSVQQPGGQGHCSGGQREMVPALARAAVATGIAGLFMEIHPDPDKALCDGPNSFPLHRVEELMAILMELDATVKAAPYIEDSEL